MTIASPLEYLKRDFHLMRSAVLDRVEFLKNKREIMSALETLLTSTDG